MNIVVDTSVWSLFLRREKRDESSPYLVKLRYHLEHEDGILLLGEILQELLDGVKHFSHFDLLVEYLGPFALIELTRSDYIEAARLKNHCRGKGIQASLIDFLIASACIARNFPLLTADKDFIHIARHSRLHLVNT
ncbi:MAG: PIN domain-containing protein [Chitinivibrionales bacterium]|nr:PIN domain-containing protein [Chitinivibrionales bacterium]